MYKVYQIEYGDTLDIISKKAKASVEKLEELNGEFDVIPGNYIVIPNNKNEIFEMYKVKNGDNMYELAKSFNINLDDLLSLNGLNKNDYIYPNQEILVPTGMSRIYVTKNGDTISKILDDLQLSMDNLLNQNGKIYLLPDQLIIYSKEQ